MMRCDELTRVTGPCAPTRDGRSEREKSWPDSIAAPLGRRCRLLVSVAMGRSSFLVAVAVVATILTLMSSSSMISSSTRLDVRHSITVLNDISSSAADGLRTYMSTSEPLAGNGSPTDVDMAGVGDMAAAVPAVDATAVPKGGADASPPPFPPPPAPLTTVPESEYDGYFLYARPETLPAGDPTYVKRLLKSLLGMAVLLKRTLVLPAALCNCRDANLTQCDGPRAPAPFDCPLREALDLSAWQAASLIKFKPARFLLPTNGVVIPDLVRCSHLRVLLPDGMDDSEMTYALRSYADVRWLEVDTADRAFCGWDTRMPGNPKRQADFLTFADGLLGASPPTTMNVCTHYRGGTGEVLQFRNLGCQGKHEVLAPRENLPDTVRQLPVGTDVMVTFATGAVSTMAINWVLTVRRIGVKEVVIGALDEQARAISDPISRLRPPSLAFARLRSPSPAFSHLLLDCAQMMTACAAANVPCVLVRGGGMQEELKKCGGNMRKCPAIYPLMSVLKVGAISPPSAHPSLPPLPFSHPLLTIVRWASIASCSPLATMCGRATPTPSLPTTHGQ